MSGGNQQKAILARWLGPMPGCLFSMNPPWGSISAPAGIFINGRASWPIKDGRCWSPPATPPNCSDYATGSLVLWRGALAANLPTRGLTLDALLVAINGGQEPSP